MLETVRPDERRSPSLSSGTLMRGGRDCALEGADVLDENRGLALERLLTFIFEEPCGEAGAGASSARCSLFMTELGGRWWVESSWLQCGTE